MWCISKITAEFISQMEQILHLYKLEPNPNCPLVCFDEKSYQVIGNTILPIPMKRGQIKKESDKYKRNGVVQILVAYLPKWGLRFVWVSPTRRAWDFASFIKTLWEEFIKKHFPKAESIQMICDNLNTHKPASFYKTFNAKEAFELSQKIEFNFTPVNASWLNIAEIEIHALSTQCLNRRLETQKLVASEVQHIVKERNDKLIKVNWQFGIEQARDKFCKAYGRVNS